MFCHHCDDSLAGHRYVLRDDHPYCIKCYENVFANNCDECGKIIGIDSKVSLHVWQNPSLRDMSVERLMICHGVAFNFEGLVLQRETLA